MLIIAHRGSSGREPENTLLAFKAAIAESADIIEADVHLCSTFQLVVIHDDTVERTTDGTGAVEELSILELRRLNAGKGEKIPLLQEVIELARGNAKLMIELKSKGCARPVAEEIEKNVKTEKNTYSDFIVTSFSVQELKDFKKYSSFVQTGFIYDSPRIDIETVFKEIRPNYMLPAKKFVNEERMKLFSKLGLKVFPWVVNEIEEKNRLERLGVDGIVTDFPNLFKAGPSE
ncbi:MAG: glycerophosphodiester phosphodiesterase family protein [Thermoplasmata archaeon]